MSMQGFRVTCAFIVIEPQNIVFDGAESEAIAQIGRKTRTFLIVQS